MLHVSVGGDVGDSGSDSVGVGDSDSVGVVVGVDNGVCVGLAEHHSIRIGAPTLEHKI
jgi:hypothetical protein